MAYATLSWAIVTARFFAAASSSTTQYVETVAITSGRDDIEIDQNGHIDASSSDLELVTDGARQQTVVLLFRYVWLCVCVWTCGRVLCAYARWFQQSC